MFVTIVYVQVKDGFIDQFQRACRLNHEASVQEPGNLRFDVLQSREEPQKFVLYEAYETKEAAVRHKDTAHYLTWRDTVADWMAEPRVGVSYEGLYPVPVK